MKGERKLMKSAKRIEYGKPVYSKSGKYIHCHQWEYYYDADGKLIYERFKSKY